MPIKSSPSSTAPCARCSINFALTAMASRSGGGRGGASHQPQPAEMGSDGAEAPLLGGVAHAEFVADFLDHLGKRRIVHVADPGEEVVFHLEVEAAEEPAQQAIAAG